MIFVILIYLLLIIEAAVQVALVGIAVYFPYVIGFLAGFSLYSVWSLNYYPNILPPYVVLIPGHPVLSFFVEIIIFELLIFISLHNDYTKKAAIVFWCVTVPAIFLTAFQITVASWQMALFVTIVGYILFGIEGYIAIKKYTPEFGEQENIIVTILNTISYCAAIAMLTYSTAYCFWEIYMNSVGKINVLSIVRNIIGVVLIAVVILKQFGSYVLERIRN